MNAGEALRGAARRLSQAGVESARRNARLLLAKAMGVCATEVWSDTLDIDRGARARLEEYVERRVAREPLAYILGHKEFWSLDFVVGPGVLVPRPETETLIDELLREFPNRTRALDIIDLGTGSGCLIIAALSMFQNGKGLAIDASEDALGWARKNVARQGLADRCELRVQDWSHEIGFRCDAILANPPYIRRDAMLALPADVARYEPATSLLGGEDGLGAFRGVAPVIARVLKAEGAAFLEIGEGQAESVKDILLAAGLVTRRVVPDLAGIPRCIVVRLAE